MVTIFPKTHDGDQIKVVFKHREEKDAFEEAIKAIKEYMERTTPENNGVVDTYRNFIFRTTLQAEVVKEHCGNAIHILGLSNLSIYQKDLVVITRYVGKR